MAERARAGRKSHTSTADLLTWTEAPPSHSSPPSSATRSHQVFFIFFISSSIMSELGFVWMLIVWLIDLLLSMLFDFDFSRLMEWVKCCLEVRSPRKKLRVLLRGLRSASLFSRFFTFSFIFNFNGLFLLHFVLCFLQILLFKE